LVDGLALTRELITCAKEAVSRLDGEPARQRATAELQALLVAPQPTSDDIRHTAMLLLAGVPLTETARRALEQRRLNMDERRLHWPVLMGLHFNNDVAFDALVGELVERGVAIDAPDGRGRTNLLMAMELGDTECVRALAVHGADPTRPGLCADGQRIATALELCQERVREGSTTYAYTELLRLLQADAARRAARAALSRPDLTTLKVEP
jgi:hypothetical protein